MKWIIRYMHILVISYYWWGLVVLSPGVVVL